MDVVWMVFWLEVVEVVPTILAFVLFRDVFFLVFSQFEFPDHVNKGRVYLSLKQIYFRLFINFQCRIMDNSTMFY